MPDLSTYDIFDIFEKLEPYEEKVVYLDDGDAHVCSKRCAQIVLTDERMFICRTSGLAWGCQQLRIDNSTGRQTGSVDADDKAGGVVGGGRWRPTRKQAIMSRFATTAVENNLIVENWASDAASPSDALQQVGAYRGEDDDEDDFKSSETTDLRKSRRTLCVGEVPFRPIKRRRRRNQRLDYSRENATLLANEAIEVLSKIFDGSATERDGFDASLRSLALKGDLNASRLHDLELFWAQKRSSRTILSLSVKNKLIALIVQLWRCVLASPCMLNRGSLSSGESFASFCSGVVILLKRGVKLHGGSEIVPKLPTLVTNLKHEAHKHALRGVATLHRALASLPDEVIFRDVATTAAELASAAAR